MLVSRPSALAAKANRMTANLYKMLSIAEANQIVQGSISPLEAIDIDLLSATGYVLASDVIAQEPLPPFPASIKASFQLKQRSTSEGSCVHVSSTQKALIWMPFVTCRTGMLCGQLMVLANLMWSSNSLRAQLQES